MKGILNAIIGFVLKYKFLLFIIAVGLHIFYFCYPKVLSDFFGSIFTNDSTIMLLNWLLTFVTASSYVGYSFLKFLNLNEESESSKELRLWRITDLKELLLTLIPLKYISSIIFFIVFNETFFHAITFGLIPLLPYIIILLSFLRIITYVVNKRFNSL